MMIKIINMLWSVLDSCLSWLLSLLDSVGESFGFGMALVSAIVVMGALFKYVLSPYLTGSGSDKANQKKKGK